MLFGASGGGGGGRGESVMSLGLGLDTFMASTFKFGASVVCFPAVGFGLGWPKPLNKVLVHSKSGLGTVTEEHAHL